MSELEAEGPIAEPWEAVGRPSEVRRPRAGLGNQSVGRRTDELPYGSLILPSQLASLTLPMSVTYPYLGSECPGVWGYALASGRQATFGVWGYALRPCR